MSDLMSAQITIQSVFSVFFDEEKEQSVASNVYTEHVNWYVLVQQMMYANRIRGRLLTCFVSVKNETATGDVLDRQLTVESREGEG